MKKSIFLLFIVTIAVLIIPTAQVAVNYTLLKQEYIQSHPGQGIIPFPWDPITKTKVLPFSYEIPAVPGNTISSLHAGINLNRLRSLLTPGGFFRNRDPG